MTDHLAILSTISNEFPSLDKGERVADVVIIGAGLTGLSTAFHLEKNNYYNYKLFEKNDRPGGLLQSVQHEGFTFDHTGHLLHISNPDFYDFLHTTSGIDNYHRVERKTGIFSHDVITDYPFQMNLFGLPTDVAVECIEGYLRRATHLKNPQNFYDWVCKYFGKGMGKHFFFPYNSKILAYNLKKVHPSWTGRFVPSTTLEAIIRGTVEKKPPSGVGYNSTFYYPKHNGIEFLVKKIVHHLKQPIHNSFEIESIDPIKKIITFTNGQTEHYNHLISTMPLNHLLSKLTNSPRSSLKQASHRLLCNAVININMGFNVPQLNNMHWIYFPEKAYPFYRLGFWHNVSPSSVPPGQTAIYGELSYIPGTMTEAQRHQKIRSTQTKILKFLGLNTTHVVTTKVLHLNHAYVIYDAWREKNLKALLSELCNHNIYSVGRYGAWKYSSMQEAFLDGKQTAQEIVNIYNHITINRHHVLTP